MITNITFINREKLVIYIRIKSSNNNHYKRIHMISIVEDILTIKLQPG
jgi:hypothetical protein